MAAVTPDAGASNPGSPATATAGAQEGAPPSSGLTAADAAARLREDGPNAIGGSGGRTRLRILAAQVASPLVLILVAASLVSLVVGDVANATIILAIVAMSAALGFVQESRSETAVAALQARLTLRASVVRDGKPDDVPVPEVVRGDLVVLGAGNIVPADARVVEANHLYVDESSLTGESAPATKRPKAGVLDPARGDDRDGLLFFGTSVVSGSGRAVVTATGPRTSYGEIAVRLAERAPENDFQRGVRQFSFIVFRVTLILVVAVLVINLAVHRPLVDSLLFAIALAVGLTPELLPAIVTLNLTQGAHALVSHGVLVKRLPAIQNLGSITVLATDKTGTLTEGRLELVRAVGIDSDDHAEAARALELAWLNSHFQAGFANPLDTALLAGMRGAAGRRHLRQAGRAAVRLRPAPAQRGRPTAGPAADAGHEGRAGGRAGPGQPGPGGERRDPADREGRVGPAFLARRQAVHRRVSPGRGRIADPRRTRPGCRRHPRAGRRPPRARSRVRGRRPVRRPAQGRRGPDHRRPRPAGRRPQGRHRRQRAGCPPRREPGRPRRRRRAGRRGDARPYPPRPGGAGPPDDHLRPHGPRPEAPRHRGPARGRGGRRLPGRRDQRRAGAAHGRRRDQRRQRHGRRPLGRRHHPARAEPGGDRPRRERGPAHVRQHPQVHPHGHELELRQHAEHDRGGPAAALPAHDAGPDPAEQPDLRRLADGDPDGQRRPGGGGPAGTLGRRLDPALHARVRARSRRCSTSPRSACCWPPWGSTRRRSTRAGSSSRCSPRCWWCWSSGRA